MRVVILPTEGEASNFAGQFIADYMNNNKNPVVGLATGSSVLLTYKALIKMHKESRLSFKDLVTFNLDEYVGLPKNHVQSYRNYMKKELFDHIDINQNNAFIPECFDDNFELACANFEDEIKKFGGIGLQLLGIGSNGHIGFNEPTSSLQSRTRVKTLTKNTLSKNARFFEANERQPSLAITMGIGTIMEAENILLIGLGKHKSKAVAEVIEGPLSAFCPGSALQNHENVTVILDKLAAADLKLYDYYIQTEKMKSEYNC
ncbi:glucosamine-6-phosphate deaminase [Candidatus Thioglobus sp.]|nr:glucosamine-6-phosphate deaminase [Candidatus Thioglobus sp.]